MKLFITAIFSLLTFFSYSQYPQWTIFTSEAGSGYAHFGYEGNYTWVAGLNSLARIDRNTGIVNIYDASNCFPFMQIEDLIIDGLGNKWLGTSWDGLLKFDGQQVTKYKILPSGDTLSIVRNLRIGPNGDLFFYAVSQTRVSVYKYDGTTFTELASWANFCPGSTISERAFELDIQGNVFMLSKCGVAKFDGTNITFFDSLNSPIQYNNIGNIMTDGKGTIWVGDYHSLYSFNGNTWMIHSDTLSHEIARWEWGYTYDDNGTMYLLYPYTPRVFTLDTNAVWSEIFSQWGNTSEYTGLGAIGIDSIYHLWTAGQNVDFQQPRIYESDGTDIRAFQTSKSALPNTTELRITTDRFNKKWITGSQHISTFDGQIWDTIVPRGPGGVIYGFYANEIKSDRYDNIWIGDRQGGNGIIKFDGTQWTKHNFSQVNAFALQNNEIPWVGTSDSSHLAYLNNGNWTFIDTAIYHLDWVQDVCADAANGIWVLGNGIAHYDGSTWSLYNNFNSPISDSVYIKASCDKYGGVWILGQQKLIRNYNNSWTEYTLPFSHYWDGLILVNDTNDIYLAGPFGLYHFDGINFIPLTHPYSAASYGNNFSDLEADKFGNIWICFQKALAIYNPNGVNPATIYNQPSCRISGTSFFDLNNNGTKDTLEAGAVYQRLYLYPDSSFQLTDHVGHYSIAADSGAHILEIQPVNQWTLTSDSATFHINTDTVNLCCFDFGVTTDLRVDSILLSLTGGIARCNSISPYWIDVINIGTTYLNSVIAFTLDPQAFFSASNPTADSVSGNIYYFHTDSLFPGSTWHVELSVHMPATAGAVLNSIVTCQTQLMFTITSLAQTVLCSFDPNEKEVYPPGLGVTHSILNSQPLEYIIHFENCGSDTAFAIRIADTLDANLDISTLAFISSSSSVNVSCVNRVLSFLFFSPQLPFTQIDSLGSQGFVKFKINPMQNLPIGTIIKNKAFIYFDFNPHVETNETFNTIDNSVTTSVIQRTNFTRIFPVPSNNQINFEVNTDTRNVLLEILNDKGLIVQKTNFNSPSFSLNTEKYQAGIYFYRLTSSIGGFLSSGKFIIVH